MLKGVLLKRKVEAQWKANVAKALVVRKEVNDATRIGFLG